MIYLIESLWLDPMENSSGYAYGYSAYGYVTTEEEAKKICDNSKMFTKSDCWALSWPTPKFRYKPIFEFSQVPKEEF